MLTENLNTLTIHKLTQEQYDRELAAGRTDPNALYLTPDVDHVIAEGTSGIWYYRKWSNGFAECWSMEYEIGWTDAMPEFFTEKYYTLPFPLMMYPFTNVSYRDGIRYVQNVECQGSNDEYATEDGGCTRICIRGTLTQFAIDEDYLNLNLHVYVAGFWRWAI